MSKSTSGKKEFRSESENESIPSLDEATPAVPPSLNVSKEEESIIDKLFKLNPERASDDEIQTLVNQAVYSEIDRTGMGEKVNILILHSDDSVSRYMADRIYRALSNVDRKLPILLILNTPGGDIAAAYLIAKLCREHTEGTFEIAVPRRAKSAGTLICCAADKIHMGSLSELGPIDPQFGTIPALALKHSVEHIAELVSDHPNASQMFSEYLSKSLPIESLGYFERVAISATQYAERLLNSRISKISKEKIDSMAKRLVYAYKDHGFVIDSREAKSIFGESIVISNTDEYEFANNIYEMLDIVDWICNRQFNRMFSYIGGSKEGCWVYQKANS